MIFHLPLLFVQSTILVWHTDLKSDFSLSKLISTLILFDFTINTQKYIFSRATNINLIFFFI
jgi:hypothetical protein